MSQKRCTEMGHQDTEESAPFLVTKRHPQCKECGIKPQSLQSISPQPTIWSEMATTGVRLRNHGGTPSVCASCLRLCSGRLRPLRKLRPSAPQNTETSSETAPVLSVKIPFGNRSSTRCFGANFSNRIISFPTSMSSIKIILLNSFEESKSSKKVFLSSSFFENSKIFYKKWKIWKIL